MERLENLALIRERCARVKPVSLNMVRDTGQAHGERCGASSVAVLTPFQASQSVRLADALSFRTDASASLREPQT